MRMKHSAFFILLFLLTLSSIAQNNGYSLSRSFTVADGLPSNHIYNVVEDNKGFLWIATDAGIARFDGKRFQTFTTRDGLPDDEVLEVVKEKSGRIWVSCFKQSPAYFDEFKNRFINSKEDSNLAKVNGTSVLNLTVLEDNGVMYTNSNGSYFFNNGKLTHQFYKNSDTWAGAVIQKFDDNSFIAAGYSKDKPGIYFIKNGQLLDSLYLNRWVNTSGQNNTIHGNKFYLPDVKEAKSYVFSDFKYNPLGFKIDSVSIGEPVFMWRFTKGYFYIISKKGNIFVFDKQSLQFRFEFVPDENFSPCLFYEDNKKNIWVGSIDKGLLLYKKRQMEIFSIPDNFTNTYFLSLARNSNGAILAGNFYSQVVETDGKYFIVHTLPQGNVTSWQRKIILSQNKIFSFSEGGTYTDFTRPVLDEKKKWVFSKTAAALNDSIIIQAGLYEMARINTVTGIRTILPGFKKRTTCIGITPDNMIYHGSTDGLYRFDMDKQQDSSLAKNHPLLAERITAICASPDNYLWVATASNGLMVLQKDNVVKIYSSAEGLISNSITCISTGRPGQIWLGTNKGISIISYSGNPQNFTYQNLTVNDGLSSNIINEILYSSDTMYCATGNGICAIPSNINLSKFDIPVQLTSVLINNKTTVLRDSYGLEYEQGNIELHIAGIELGGHFNNFQYRINKGNWINLDVNTLNLQLNSGKYTIEIKAIDVNGNEGTKPLVILFTIATPFWKSLWFWILLTLLIAALIIWLMKKNERARRESALQGLLNQKKFTELELQALKAQINPHFIFNCLNSIKLLSHLQKHAEAEKYLDRFAALLRSAMEQSSLQQITLQTEINFIENYLSLEKLRMPERLSYTIEVDKNIDADALLIPSMLLQPYIENAVKHGIAHLKNNLGLVEVKFYKKDDYLIAEIQDNGNGIGNTMAAGESTGIGIINTERRSRLYNIESNIIDLSLVDEHLTGTKVQLKIPLV
jgi:ligand-binding sensor domain-containing protein